MWTQRNHYRYRIINGNSDWQWTVRISNKRLKMIKNEILLRKRFHFSGSYLYSIQIRPRPNVQLLKWNLLDFVPEQNDVNGHTGYYAMVTHGLEAPPLELHMEFDVIYWSDQKNNCLSQWRLIGLSSWFQAKTGHSGPLVDVSIVTFNWEFKPTPVFANLLARVPKWAFPVPSTASLQAFTF